MSNKGTLDKNIAKYIEETNLLPKSYNDLYKKNTSVTVKVENVVKYGVFVQIRMKTREKVYCILQSFKICMLNVLKISCKLGI